MAITKRSQRQRAARADQQAREWNEANPIGTPVNVRKDDGSVLATRTRSEAWTLGASCHGPGHTAVVMVEGISGGYLLDRVTRRAEPEAVGA